ncbi:MAG: hypothetical protein KDC33_09860 [Thermoleophilia bacterium]|nr:hypothetical protein [Thermoleophilia bacterium]
MPSPLTPLEYIEHFLGGESVDEASARDFFRTWVADVGADPQMAAWMVHAARAGVDDSTLFALVSELVASGQRLELASLGPVGSIVSTGALGDAVALVAIPIAAALGVRVLCDAEEGVGVFGGLGEQLASIPGFLDGLPLRDAIAGLAEGGCATSTGMGEIAPAQRRLAALRAHTGLGRDPSTVAASVVARVLALGAPAACIHVPFGDGAMVPDRAGADRVAAVAAAFGEAWGRRLPVVLTEVPAIIGPGLGHAPSVRAAAQVLDGGGDAGLRDAATRVAGALAAALGLGDEGDAGRAIADGSAREAAGRWVAAHHARPNVWTEAGGPPLAPHTREVIAAAAGEVRVSSPGALGAAVRRLGAGRLHPIQSVDPGVGVVFSIVPGEQAEAGETIATVHGRDAYMADAVRDEIAALVGGRRA